MGFNKFFQNDILFLLLLILSIKVSDVYTQTPPITIAEGYAILPDTCHFLPPSDDGFPTFPLMKTYWGEIVIPPDNNPSASVVLQVNPTYRFDGATNPLNWTQGVIFVPDKISIPFPYCMIDLGWNVFAQAPYITPTTAGCNPPKSLLYGFEDIPAAGAQSLVEIGQAVLIAGLVSFRLDFGYPFPWAGVITWFRPTATCTTPNVNFQLLTNITGMTDQYVGLSPSRYTDSASGFTRSCPLPGLYCTNVPRPVGSALYDAKPEIIATCIQSMPYNSSWSLSQKAEYAARYGLGVRQPNNVELNAVTYQFRTDNLVPPIAIKRFLALQYVGGSFPINTVLGDPDGFDIIQSEVLFKPSLGINPAIARGRFYNFVTPFIDLYNERQLGFLPQCACGINIPCNSTNDLLEDHEASTNPDDPAPTGRNKTSIPNWNNAVTFVAQPTCNFTINNGLEVFAGESFVVTSLAGGGVGTILYNWQLWLVPASGGVIANPINKQQSIVTVTINAPSINSTNLVAINHTVMNLYGEAVTCTKYFVVFADGPLASLVPSDTTIFLGDSLTLDASGSTSPVGFASIIFNFTIVFNPGGNGILIRDRSRPVVLFTALATGVYVVMVQVHNEISSATANAVIRVVPPGTVIPSPLAPTVPVGGNFTCFNPLPPFNYTVPPPTAPTPITPIPASPGTPPINPPLPAPGTPGAPGTPPPGIIGPVAQLTQFTMTLFYLMIGTTIAILLGAGIFAVCYGRYTQTNSITIRDKQR